MSKDTKKHAFFDDERGQELMARVRHVKRSLGASYAVKYYARERLTRGQGIIAKCAECMCWYIDGMRDCKMPDCPLYEWMPYRESRKRYVRPDRRKEETTND